MVTAAVLVGLLAVAAVTDLGRGKIYNWNTYFGILLGFALNATGGSLAAIGAADEAVLDRLGWIGLGQSLLGFLVCGSLLVFCYVLFRGGISGGDVKLMAMAGALAGPERGLEIMLWTFILGGCLALIVLVWKIGPWRLAWRLVRLVACRLRLAWFTPPSAEEQAELKEPLFLAPAAVVAAVIVEGHFFG